MPSRMMRRAGAAGLACLALMAASPGRAAAGPDESALRFYAATKQTTRLDLETKRLRALDPSWQVPDDLGQEELGRADEAQLWELFGADRLDDLTQAIEERGRRQPGWRPSASLTAKLARKRLRAELLREGAAGHWDEVTRLAASLKPDPRDPALTWIVAEGLLRTRREADGLVALRRLLAASSDPAVRLATVQKGLGLLGLEAVETLIAQGRTGENGRSEWEPIALDITRARIAGFLRRQRSTDIPRPDVEALARTVRAAHDSPGASLLGWYAFQRDDLREALDWFKLSLATGGDAMTAHGLAHTLRRLGYVRDAEDVAYAWRQPLVQNAILFTDIVEEQLTSARPIFVEPERLERYGRVVSETQSGEGAQALAWYAHNLCQFEVALPWFERAVAWFPKEATVLGYAVTLRRLNRQRDFIQVVNRYDGLFPRVVDLLLREGDTSERLACDDRNPGVAGASAKPGIRTIEPVRPTVPVPGGTRPDAAVEKRRPGFPIWVWEENPRRVRDDTAFDLERSSESTRPGRERAPLVARRVLGVTAMRYEATGTALLPAYDGTNAPAAVGSTELSAPRGTIWARELSKRSVDVPRAELPRPPGATLRPIASAMSSTASGRTP